MSITDIRELSHLASTTLASYAALRGADQLAPSLTSPTSGANFTAIQASAFTARYTLLHQRPNVDLNGFSAAVFQDKVTGRKVLAIRGTEFTQGLGQIITDFVLTDILGIGVAGYASMQAAELFRYFKATLQKLDVGTVPALSTA